MYLDILYYICVLFNIYYSVISIIYINIYRMQDNYENIRKKRTCKNFTTVDKLKILKECENASVSQVSRNHNISEQTVRNWKKRKLQLEELGKSERKLQIKRVRKPICEALDRALYIWYLEIRSRRIPLTGSIIKGEYIQYFIYFK